MVHNINDDSRIALPNATLGRRLFSTYSFKIQPATKTQSLEEGEVMSVDSHNRAIPQTATKTIESHRYFELHAYVILIVSYRSGFGYKPH